MWSKSNASNDRLETSVSSVAWIFFPPSWKSFVLSWAILGAVFFYSLEFQIFHSNIIHISLGDLLNNIIQLC